MKNLKKIFNKISKENSNIYNYESTSLILLICSKISNFLSPIFIFLNLDPNKITYLNFVNSMIIIFLIFIDIDNSIELAIFLYFFYLVLDFCDGSVARYLKKTTFYGKFIDGLFDIFLKTFLIFSLSIYSYSNLNSLNLLILGCISSILISFDTFIYDRYSALVRWYNLEKKKNIIPYIKKIFLKRFFFILNDIFYLLIFLIIITKNNNTMLLYNFVVLFSLSIFTALLNILVHLFFSFKNLK